MKKLIIIFAALVLCLGLASCGAKEPAETTAAETTVETTAQTTAETTAAAVGMPNPVVPYDSLEEINKAVGVNLMKPASAEAANERFSVIDGGIAQYVCEIDGKEWTFRAACIPDEDISGIYSEHNTFAPGEDNGFYDNEYYLTRFFDGDRQYTIVAKDPISPDGDILIDEETFMNYCMELEAIQKQHMDDPLVGDYHDVKDQDVSAFVERHGDVYIISAGRFDPDNTYRCWTMVDAVRDGDRLSYQGEEYGVFTYDAEWNETSSNITMSAEPGYFEIRDGLLYWTGAAREECRAFVFEKIIYEE